MKYKKTIKGKYRDILVWEALGGYPYFYMEWLNLAWTERWEYWNEWKRKLKDRKEIISREHSEYHPFDSFGEI